MITHTKWPWFSGHNDAPEPEYLVSYPETGGMIALVPRQGDSKLIAIAPTAPHFCHYPKCPGNINRLKLEIYDDLLAYVRSSVAMFGGELGGKLLSRANEIG